MRYKNSPPRELELVEEVVASLEDHKGLERGEMSQMTRELNPTKVQLPRSRTPRRAGGMSL